MGGGSFRVGGVVVEWVWEAEAGTLTKYSIVILKGFIPPGLNFSITLVSICTSTEHVLGLKNFKNI